MSLSPRDSIRLSMGIVDEINLGPRIVAQTIILPQYYLSPALMRLIGKTNTSPNLILG
jgi:hypothetical protein